MSLYVSQKPDHLEYYMHEVCAYRLAHEQHFRGGSVTLKQILFHKNGNPLRTRSLMHRPLVRQANN